MTLFHYTDARGPASILASGVLLPSTASRNPNDVRYDNGQYLSDIPPGTMTTAHLSRRFLNLPFYGRRFTHFVEINVDGLQVVAGRAGVLVVPNELPLDVSTRVVRHREVPETFEGTR
jgi:hypothetical protein